MKKKKGQLGKQMWYRRASWLNLFYQQGRPGKRFVIFVHIQFYSLWTDLQWYSKWNQCNNLILFRILLLGNPFTFSELKRTSRCSTFPNAVLLVRTLEHFIIVMNLLPCGCVTTDSRDVLYVEWICTQPNHNIYVFKSSETNDNAECCISRALSTGPEDKQ